MICLIRFVGSGGRSWSRYRLLAESRLAANVLVALAIVLVLRELR